MAVVQHPVRPFNDIVELSLDEAIFLWRRWETELASPTRNLDEVWSWTEDRLHGALDGVTLVDPRGFDLVVEGLHSEERDVIAVSAGILAASHDRRAIETLGAAVNAGIGDKLRAMLRGIELRGSDAALRAAASALATRGAAYAGELCRLKAFRRAPCGDEAHAAFATSTPAFQLEAVRAAGYISSRVSEQLLATALQSDTPELRAAAMESSISLSIDNGWRHGLHPGRGFDHDAGPLLKLLATFGSEEEHEAVYDALRVPALQIEAIHALGHIGTTRAVESCLFGMRYEQLARAAGEAYCWITGADLDRDHLALKEASPDVPAFEDDDLDANLVPPPEVFWPRPDPEAVRRDWDARVTTFSAHARHIQGRPATLDTLLTIAETGPMLRRVDVLLELRARTRGRYDVEARAFTPRQRQMMARGRSVASAN